jgi:hypothetical protein
MKCPLRESDVILCWSIKIKALSYSFRFSLFDRSHFLPAFLKTIPLPCSLICHVIWLGCSSVSCYSSVHFMERLMLASIVRTPEASDRDTRDIRMRRFPASADSFVRVNRSTDDQQQSRSIQNPWSLYDVHNRFIVARIMYSCSCDELLVCDPLQ